MKKAKFLFPIYLWKWLVAGVVDVAGEATAGAIAGAVQASSAATSLVDWIDPEEAE